MYASTELEMLQLPGWFLGLLLHPLIHNLTWGMAGVGVKRPSCWPELNYMLLLVALQCELGRL